MSKILTHRRSGILHRGFLFPFLPSGRRLRKLITYFHGVTENIIKERKSQYSTDGDNRDSEGKNVDSNNGLKRRKPFLDLLLEYNIEGAGMTDEDIRMQVDTFMVAGHETVQSAISLALYCLSQNPQVQEKAYEEVMNLLKDDDKDATFQDLQNMIYLEKVIKEVMRLYPATTVIARKASEDLDLKNGYVIPKNTTVMVLIEAMNHDSELYPEPLKFDPERFERKDLHPFSYLPFGVGVRNCIGKRYAMLVMKSVISRVLRKIHIFPSNIPLVVKDDIALKSTTGVNIRIKPRCLPT